MVGKKRNLHVFLVWDSCWMIDQFVRFQKKIRLLDQRYSQCEVQCVVPLRPVGRLFP